MSRVLLVQPAFPIPSKSHHHKDYLPVGLLSSPHGVNNREMSRTESGQPANGLLPR